MAKITEFTDLEVWQKSHQLVIDMYKIVSDFPDEEKFRLTDQLCRSAASIPANIAEGKGRNTINEYIQFLYTARGSVEETKYHLLLARDLGYLSKDQQKTFWNRYREVGKMINGLIKSLKKSEEA